MNIGYCMRGLTSYEDTLIRDIFDEAVNQRPLYNYAIDTKLLEFLFRVIRRERQGIEMVVNRAESSSFLPESGSQFSAKIQPVIDHIKTNVNNKFTISELADLAGYSENYFSSLFKECTGYPPNKYINILKVKKAKERILYTSDSITQISEELGFESVHYFSKVFKQITGMSPSNYVDRSKINMVINMIKDSPLLPQEGQYEFQLKNIDERVDN
ncbi:MAG: AraC family transcriptional regulator [Eubacteriales bacterium]|nr:AraC family transcriptional regulator [Eubacteriales bacterium]